MKNTLITLMTACVLAVVSIGCGSETTVDSSKLKAAFGNASGDAKTHADAAIAAIDSGDMRGASTALAKLTEIEGLTQSQIDAAGETFTLVGTIILEQGAEAGAADAKAKKGEIEAQAQGAQ